MTVTPKEYIQKQAANSAVINTVLNGLIAFFSYRTRDMIPYGEAAVDILITVAIITFFTAWILIGSTRQEFAKGNFSRLAAVTRKIKLPEGSALRALVICIGCVVVFGGLLDGLLYVLVPAGLSNWAYIGLKTIYTGVSAAIAAVLAIQSVVNDESRS